MNLVQKIALLGSAMLALGLTSAQAQDRDEITYNSHVGKIINEN